MKAATSNSARDYVRRGGSITKIRLQQRASLNGENAVLKSNGVTLKVAGSVIKANQSK